jgi:hypothetical protein
MPLKSVCNNLCFSSFGLFFGQQFSYVCNEFLFLKKTEILIFLGVVSVFDYLSTDSFTSFGSDK